VSGLTPKQDRFVQEYLADPNGAAAYRRAYPSCKSDRAAEAAASRLLRNVKVAAAIAAGQAARAERTQVTADRVVQELARVAFADARRLMTWGPDGVRLRPSGELTEAEAAAVESVAETTTNAGGSVKLKTHSKVAALKLLGEHLGVFKEREPLEVLLASLPPELAGALRRALGAYAAGGGDPPGGGAAGAAPAAG
jgi:phage terminase small subunit